MPISPRRGWRYFAPNRIDLYILGEVIGPFLGGIAFFVFIFLMFQALRLAEFFIIHGVSGATLLNLGSLLALSFTPTALPVAFLIAVLSAFGRLSADSELVALKSGGISVIRMAAPVTACAFVVVAISLFLNLNWVPSGLLAFKQALIKVGNTKVVSSISAGTFTSGFFNLIIFADHVDAKTKQMKHVFIYDEREPKNPLTVVAKYGEIIQLKPTSEFGSSIMLKLYDGSIHRNDNSESTYQKIGFGEYRLYIKVDEGSEAATMKPQMLPYEDLKQKIGATTPNSPEGAAMRGEYWRRYSIAISPFIFAFLGIGWGTVRTRTARASAILIAFVTLLFYWSLQSWGTTLILSGSLPAFWGMQLPNIALTFAALVGFRRALW